MTFRAPQLLVLLVVLGGLGAAYVAVQGRRRRYAVRFTNLALLDLVAPTRPAWRRHVVAAGFLCSAAALVLALAEPVHTVATRQRHATIVLAIDVSPSMRATDITPTRLLAAQQAAAEFVNRLPDGDAVGLVSFAGSAVVAMPPTTDHRLVLRALSRLGYRSETALGEAILASLDALQARPTTAPTSGTNVLLLSDGASTAGRPVDAGIAAAAAADVPVSTIAFGTRDGTVELGGEVLSVPPDETALAAIAEGTGGRFFRAQSATELRAVYQQLATDVVLVEVDRDLARVFVGTGVAGLLLTAIGSLRWFARLP